jgi:hypothetical protein
MLPPEMPVGAMVAIVVLPTNVPQIDITSERQARFEATLTAIRAASDAGTKPLPSDEELDNLIEQVRKSPKM